MAIDKLWMAIKNRRSIEYLKGATNFIAYAFTHSAVDDMIICPRAKCRNVNYCSSIDVMFHLLKNGINKSYTTRHFHGKTLNEDEYSNGQNEYSDGQNDDQHENYEDVDMIELLDDI